MDIKKKIEEKVSAYIMAETLKLTMKIVKNPAYPVEVVGRGIESLGRGLDSLGKGVDNVRRKVDAFLLKK